MARYAGVVIGGALFGVLAGTAAFLRQAKSEAAQTYPTQQNGHDHAK